MANQPGFYTPAFARGHHLGASDLNNITAHLIRVLTGGNGIKVRTIGDRIIIEGESLQRGITGSSSVKRFVFVSEDGDFLNVETPEGAAEVILKSYLLRRTPFDGLTRAGITYTYSADNAREADDGVDTENQVIVPSYVAGDEILAVRGILNGSGDSEVPFVDLNVDGRAWAKEDE